MGKYNTKQKEYILEYMKENKGKHITVEEVFTHLRSNSIKIGTATIYRNFKILSDEGLIIKYNNEPGVPTCYEYFDGEKNKFQYHFKCESCGELFHFECSLLDGLKNHIDLDHEFSINRIKTVFYGVCKRCSVKEV